MSFQSRVVASLVSLLLVLSGCEQKQLPARVDSSFSMERDSLSFPNFVVGYDGSALDPEGMRRMFGDGVCANGSGTPCLLTPPARAFMDDANQAMTGGRCEGFAVLSTLLADDKLDVTSFGADTARALKLDDNRPLQRELAYWFSTQLVSAAVGDKTKAYQAKDVMPVLAEALADGATERYRIGIVRKNGAVVSGGHSLTPLGYYRDPKVPTTYWVRVYDNNNPDAERLIKVDTLANRWEFEAATDPKTSSRLYWGDATNNNPLYLAPIYSRQGTLPCPFCAEGGAQVLTEGGAQVVVDTPAGPVGLSEGAFVASDGTSVTPSFSAELDSEPTSVVIGVSGSAMSGMSELTAHVTAPSDPENPDVRQAVGLLNATIRSRVSDLHVTANDTFSAGSTGARYQNTSRTELALSTEVTRPDGMGTLSVTARINGGSDEVNTNVDPSTGKVNVGVGGAMGTEVVVVVTQTDAMGEENSAQLTFTSSGDAGLEADTAGWMDGGTLTAVVENGGTTMTVTDACTDGVQSGMESDVDCGHVCGQQCELGRACVDGTDCASGLCHATTKTCVADACLDGARSSGETDVDCGGTSCAACATGRACGSDGDCVTGACRGNLCVATYVLGVTVSGLPFGDSVTLANGSDSLVVNGDGSFPFATRITGAYAVTISTQAARATCVVNGGTGTATADTSVSVTCTPTWQLGGTVSGLTSGSVVLANGSDSVTVSADGSFSFGTRITDSYAVTITTQPAGQLCTVTNGSGTASGDVSDVQVDCVSGFTIGGTVTGLTSGQLILRNGSDFLPLFASGAFTFPTPVVGAYAVTVDSQPAGLHCIIFNGSGTATANVTNISVRCWAPGTLDTSFGTGGWTSTSLVAGSDLWVDGQVLSDDSMVLVGQQSTSGSDSDWVVSKVTAAGALDTSFGTNGHFILNRGVAIEYARAIRTSGTGYLVMGNLWGGTNTDLGVARLTAAGALDPSFGTGGVATYDSGQWEYFEKAAFDAQGRTVLVGRRSATGSGPHDAVVARLGVDGTLDTTFGTGGFIVYDSGGDDSGNTIAVDPTTQDYVVGVSAGGSTIVLRYTNTGTPEPTFGTNGVATFDLAGGARTQILYRAQATSTGTLLVGRADNASNADLVVAHVLSNGTLDPAFGTGGVVRIDRGGHEVGYAIARSQAGEWYIGGHHDNFMLVTKLSETGVVDTTFGSSGFFEDVLNTSALAYHLMLDVQQRLVAVGVVRVTGSEDLGVARLNP